MSGIDRAVLVFGWVVVLSLAGVGAAGLILTAQGHDVRWSVCGRVAR